MHTMKQKWLENACSAFCYGRRMHTIQVIVGEYKNALFEGG